MVFSSSRGPEAWKINSKSTWECYTFHFRKGLDILCWVFLEFVTCPVSFNRLILCKFSWKCPGWTALSGCATLWFLWPHNSALLDWRVMRVTTLQLKMSWEQFPLNMLWNSGVSFYVSETSPNSIVKMNVLCVVIV